eukprot:CAMPEP_0174261706 /NCGR_PEP_ID=MMETSP0439-20130205/11890_1 /TAXON_ID=0 /ORGANISM="Stereomyxa ramosa, Strain Chinc5" /LENGTH=167 /DNA_ID=CAMNT_0015346239 /DNA_START=36 /DNA_END=536 /DNA_ORIENTATION=+
MRKEKGKAKPRRVASEPSSLASFDEARFRRQVDAALAQIKTILENARNPKYPADVDHKYEDKYLLASFLTNTAFASQLTCLHMLGLSADDLETLVEWSSSRSVTLCLTAEERCKFDHKDTYDVESKTKLVTEKKSWTGSTKTKTRKMVTTVTDYYWKFDSEYELFAY